MAGRVDLAQVGILTLAGIVVATVVTVATARMSGYQPPAPEASPVVASRELAFRDDGDGSVLVYDWRSGEQLADLAPGEGSFVRGVMRSLTRERRSREAGSDAPFQISRHQDGSLVLEDPATGERIELQAFGPTNAGAFATLLDHEPGGG
jgi:putative photosynthetic complex assembly protein